MVPVRYGVSISAWNPGEEKSLDKREGETGADQQAYRYEGDPVSALRCGKEPNFCIEWVNTRFGKLLGYHRDLPSWRTADILYNVQLLLKI